MAKTDLDDATISNDQKSRIKVDNIAVPVDQKDKNKAPAVKTSKLGSGKRNEDKAKDLEQSIMTQFLKKESVSQQRCHPKTKEVN